MGDGSGLLRISQDHESPVTVVRGRGWTCRYAYARAAELREQGGTGQDYLVWRESAQAVAFALCDGVSQSFFGDLAAYFLGEALLEWLWGDLSPILDTEALRIALVKQLRAWAGRATELVQSYPVSHDLPKLLREVLEEKRALGSQSTFVSGRFDWPSRELPQGRVMLTWMGDSRLRVWGPDGERTAELGGGLETAQRWSTLKGPIGGEPHLFVAPLVGREAAFSTVMIYSDGLAVLDQLAQPPSNEALQEFIYRSEVAPMSDDIAFWEVRLSADLAQAARGDEPIEEIVSVGSLVAAGLHEQPVLITPEVGMPTSVGAHRPRRGLVGWRRSALVIVGVMLLLAIGLFLLLSTLRQHRPQPTPNPTVVLAPTARPSRDNSRGPGIPR